MKLGGIPVIIPLHYDPSQIFTAMTTQDMMALGECIFHHLNLGRTAPSALKAVVFCSPSQPQELPRSHAGHVELEVFVAGCGQTSGAFGAARTHKDASWTIKLLSSMSLKLSSN